MGLFGRRKNKGTDVFPPANGRLRSIEDVPDPVFAKKVLGDGFAVEPSDGDFVAPMAGELILLADTLHAFAIRADDGLEVLVHIGIDTVKMKGEGFASSRTVGDKVAVGDVIVTVDLDVVSGKVPSMMTPVVLTNGGDFTVSDADLDGGGGPVLTVTA